MKEETQKFEMPTLSRVKDAADIDVAPGYVLLKVFRSDKIGDLYLPEAASSLGVYHQVIKVGEGFEQYAGKTVIHLVRSLMSPFKIGNDEFWLVPGAAIGSFIDEDKLRKA